MNEDKMNNDDQSKKRKLVVNTFYLAHSTRTPIQLPQNVLFLNVGAPMKIAKLQDIQKTLDYIPDEHKHFYINIISKSIVANYLENVQ